MAIVEAGRDGGTCVIRSCVPKKLMMYAAGFRSVFAEAAGFGWTQIAGGFERARRAQAKAVEIARLEGVYRNLLAQAGVQLIDGRAHIEAPAGSTSKRTRCTHRTSSSPPVARRRATRCPDCRPR